MLFFIYWIWIFHEIICLYDEKFFGMRFGCWRFRFQYAPEWQFTDLAFEGRRAEYYIVELL